MRRACSPVYDHAELFSGGTMEEHLVLDLVICIISFCPQGLQLVSFFCHHDDGRFKATLLLGVGKEKG